MKFFPDMKSFVRIGDFSITWYAILILTGALITYYLSIRNFKKRGYNLEMLDDLFFGGLISGIVGARLWYVLFYDLSGYVSNPIRILDFREGGLAIHGGLILGVLFGYFYIKRKGYTFMRHADEVVYNILIAQAIGRWGNFMNHEAFGGVVDASYFNGWPSFIKDNMFIGGQYHQPTFLYESSLNILGWILIHFGLRKSKNLKEGDLVWAYMMWYGVVRFFVEGLRTDSLYFFNFRIAQLVSIGMILIGVLGFLGVYRKIFKAKKPTLIFDFDGTIANTEPIINKVFKEIFADYPEVKLTEADYVSMVGPTLEETFTKYLPNENAAELAERYRLRNKELHPQMIELLPHVKETLETLKSDGYTLAIASNKKSEMIHYGLELTGIDQLFAIVVGSDSVANTKPNGDMLDLIVKELHVKKDNIIYVGDTVLDMTMGKHYNAYTVGYNVDANRLEGLGEARPNRLIGDWRELLELVKEERLWIYNTK